MDSSGQAAYVQLISSVQADSLVESAFSYPVDELHVQSLWFAGQFGRVFTTTEGKSVRIIQFGEWNRSAGPDFHQVALEIDGEIQSGAIEIDQSPDQWEHHGHSTNPNYDNVCLHICITGDSGKKSFTKTSQHRQVPRVILDPDSLSKALNQPRFKQAVTHIGRCSTPLAEFEPERIDSLLKAASRHRIRRKAARLSRTIDAQGNDQALFQSIAETLGYRPNQMPMRYFVQKLTLSQLRSNPEAIEAVLFGTAGFLSSDLHETASPDSRDYLLALWQEWWKFRDQYSLEAHRVPKWTFAGQRPGNHIHRRLGTLSLLVKQWDGFRSACHGASKSPVRLFEFANELNHPHWSEHYTLTSKRSAKPIALFGKERARDFIVNHLVPRAILNSDEAWNHFFNLRAGSANNAVKRALIRLMGQREDASSFTKYAWQQQALLQIYQDFCLNDLTECESCPFPEQLLQWS